VGVILCLARLDVLVGHCLWGGCEGLWEEQAQACSTGSTRVQLPKGRSPLAGNKAPSGVS